MNAQLRCSHASAPYRAWKGSVQPSGRPKLDSFFSTEERREMVREYNPVPLAQWHINRVAGMSHDDFQYLLDLVSNGKKPYDPMGSFYPPYGYPEARLDHSENPEASLRSLLASKLPNVKGKVCPKANRHGPIGPEPGSKPTLNTARDDYYKDLEIRLEACLEACLQRRLAQKALAAEKALAAAGIRLTPDETLVPMHPSGQTVAHGRAVGSNIVQGQSSAPTAVLGQLSRPTKVTKVTKVTIVTIVQGQVPAPTAVQGQVSESTVVQGEVSESTVVPPAASRLNPTVAPFEPGAGPVVPIAAPVVPVAAPQPSGSRYIPILEMNRDIYEPNETDTQGNFLPLRTMARQIQLALKVYGAAKVNNYLKYHLGMAPVELSPQVVAFVIVRGSTTHSRQTSGGSNESGQARTQASSAQSGFESVEGFAYTYGFISNNPSQTNWICRDAGCYRENASGDQACSACHTPRPYQANRTQKSSELRSPGDWICAKAGCYKINWERRRFCFFCYPDAPGNEEPSKNKRGPSPTNMAQRGLSASRPYDSTIPTIRQQIAQIAHRADLHLKQYLASIWSTDDSQSVDGEPATSERPATATSQSSPTSRSRSSLQSWYTSSHTSLEMGVGSDSGGYASSSDAREYKVGEMVNAGRANEGGEV